MNLTQALQMFFRVMDVVIIVSAAEKVDIVLVILDSHVDAVRLPYLRRQLIQRRPQCRYVGLQLRFSSQGYLVFLTRVC